MSARPLAAQGMGNAGTITGTVTDPSGAVVAGATVTIENKVTGFSRTVTTEADGTYKILGVPQNNYHMTVTATGFQQHVADIEVRTTVAINLPVSLSLASSAVSVEVHSESDLIESVPTAHVDIDASQFSRLPSSQIGSGINSAVAHSAPGIIEDSNGFIHPQGDHAQTQFVFDNQPITDQQSKQFSTSMPENAIASVEVITGAPPAE
ncbi:MAG TPA: carboxypeptidase-like regulatory domain-containing protein, partial [Bryobacteraceae bacterium]|nr:carboxypeptidase-like regulatory domain-containing protein [Bryobacteraceae bacterium]